MNERATRAEERATRTNERTVRVEGRATRATREEGEGATRMDERTRLLEIEEEDEEDEGEWGGPYFYIDVVIGFLFVVFVLMITLQGIRRNPVYI